MNKGPFFRDPKPSTVRLQRGEAASRGAVERLSTVPLAAASQPLSVLLSPHLSLSLSPLPVGMASGRLLEVYLDLLSQPCRAVYLLLNACNIPHTVRTVALRKGELFLSHAKGSELV